MRPDLSLTPSRSDRIPEWVVTACCAVMVIAALFLMLSVGVPLISELLFVIAAVVAVWLSTRFLMTSYTYTVNYEEGVFLVTERKGKRLSVLCRLDLSSLSRVTAGDTTCAGTERYRYLVSYRPRSVYTLIFLHDGVSVSVVAEGDETFFGELSRIAGENETVARDADSDLEQY